MHGSSALGTGVCMDSHRSAEATETHPREDMQGMGWDTTGEWEGYEADLAHSKTPCASHSGTAAPTTGVRHCPDPAKHETLRGELMSLDLQASTQNRYGGGHPKVVRHDPLQVLRERSFARTGSHAAFNAVLSQAQANPCLQA